MGNDLDLCVRPASKLGRKAKREEMPVVRYTIRSGSVLFMKNKKCPTCKSALPLTKEFWSVSRRRPDGFEWQCKKCKRARDTAHSRKIRDARRYKKDKWKMNAREKARNHYHGILLWCAVTTCTEKAQELHHVDYKEALSVVPLCKKHHRGMHD